MVVLPLSVAQEQEGTSAGPFPASAEKAEKTLYEEGFPQIRNTEQRDYHRSLQDVYACRLSRQLNFELSRANGDIGKLIKLTGQKSTVRQQLLYARWYVVIDGNAYGYKRSHGLTAIVYHHHDYVATEFSQIGIQESVDI